MKLTDWLSNDSTLKPTGLIEKSPGISHIDVSPENEVFVFLHPRNGKFISGKPLIRLEDDSTLQSVMNETRLFFARTSSEQRNEVSNYSDDTIFPRHWGLRGSTMRRLHLYCSNHKQQHSRTGGNTPHVTIREENPPDGLLPGRVTPGQWRQASDARPVTLNVLAGVYR